MARKVARRPTPRVDRDQVVW